MRSRFIRLTVLLCASSALAQGVEAQEVPSRERQRAVESLADAVRTHYVLPEVASLLADSIEAWRPATDAPLERSEFIASLLEDLIRWSGDQHFLLFHPSLPPRGLSERIIAVMGGEACWADTTSESGVQVLSNIVRLPAADRVACAMSRVTDASHLILDLRECTGGSRASVAELLSYFFTDPIQFATYYERGEAPEADFTRDVARGYLGGASLAVLIGDSTASGCEAVAYHLQQLGRAIIVGMTSVGASHAVRTFDLAAGYRAFIPVVRSTDSVSATNWERVGVKPDFVANSDDSLQEAIRLLQAGR